MSSASKHETHVKQHTRTSTTIRWTNALRRWTHASPHNGPLTASHMNIHQVHLDRVLIGEGSCLGQQPQQLEFGQRLKTADAPLMRRLVRWPVYQSYFVTAGETRGPAADEGVMVSRHQRATTLLAEIRRNSTGTYVRSGRASIRIDRIMDTCYLGRWPERYPSSVSCNIASSVEYLL